MFERIGIAHVVIGRRLQPSVYDVARYAGPDAARPHVYDAAAAALAAPCDKPQTIVCLGPGAADIADVLCAFIARNNATWTALCDVFAIVCPGGAERVVFSLHAETNKVVGVHWGVPQPPYDVAPLISFMREHLPNRLRAQLGLAPRAEETSINYQHFMDSLAMLDIRGDALLWRAVRVIDCLRSDTPASAAPLLGLEVPVVVRNAGALATVVHRRIIDWIAGRGHASTGRAPSATVRTVTVWTEPPATKPATTSFDSLCRAAVADVLHANLDASFVAADRNERTADGCKAGTAAPGRFSCDYVATTLMAALREAESGASLVAAVGCPLTITHARGAAVYTDVEAWYEADHNVMGGVAQKLLMGSLLGPLTTPTSETARRGSCVQMTSPGRGPPSVFGVRIDAAVRDFNGSVALHWVCCADDATVERMSALQRAAGLLHVRIPFDDFVGRFATAAPTVPRTPAAILAATVGRKSMSRVGDQRFVWLSSAARRYLEQLCTNRRTMAAVRLQAWWRGVRARRRFVAVQNAVRAVQQRRRRKPHASRELIMLRTIVHRTFPLEYRWDCAHGGGAYEGVPAALAAAMRSPVLSALRRDGMAATVAVVLRLMRYACFSSEAYRALSEGIVYSGAVAEALAVVRAADPDGDCAQLERLWAVTVRVVARRIVDAEWPVLDAVVRGLADAEVGRAGVAAWARIDAAVGRSIVADSVMAAVYAEIDGRCVATMVVTRGMSAENALAAKEWLTYCNAALPRWQSALQICALVKKDVVLDADVRAMLCARLTAGEIRAISGVAVPAGGESVLPLLPLPAVSGDVVAAAYAMDVSFY